MIIKKTVFNIFYPLIQDLRKKIFIIEDNFSEKYIKPFTLIPVPENAPLNIPIIIAKTVNGHSNVEFSPLRTQITTNYSGEYQKKWLMCLEYLKKHITEVLYTIDKTTKFFLYGGLSITIDVDEHENSLDKMAKFLNFKSSQPLYDANSRFVFIYKDTYYINITLSNTRTFKGTLNVSDSGVQSLYNLESGNPVFTMTIDINNKCAFNTKENYRTTNTEIEKILTIIDDLIKNKYQNFIEGDFTYE